MTGLVKGLLFAASGGLGTSTIEFFLHCNVIDYIKDKIVGAEKKVVFTAEQLTHYVNEIAQKVYKVGFEHGQKAAQQAGVKIETIEEKAEEVAS